MGEYLINSQKNKRLAAPFYFKKKILKAKATSEVAFTFSKKKINYFAVQARQTPMNNLDLKNPFITTKSWREGLVAISRITNPFLGHRTFLKQKFLLKKNDRQARQWLSFIYRGQQYFSSLKCVARIKKNFRTSLNSYNRNFNVKNPFPQALERKPLRKVSLLYFKCLNIPSPLKKKKIESFSR